MCYPKVKVGKSCQFDLFHRQLYRHEFNVCKPILIRTGTHSIYIYAEQVCKSNNGIENIHSLLSLEQTTIEPTNEQTNERMCVCINTDRNP